MAVGTIERIGRNTNNALAAFGDFSVFTARVFRWLWGWLLHWKNVRLLFPLMYEVRVRSVPVISVTGAFIGMVMAIETFTQFQSIGQEERIGGVISVSVVKQIGPAVHETIRQTLEGGFTNEPYIGSLENELSSGVVIDLTRDGVELESYSEA